MTDDLVKRLRDEDNDEPLNELLDAAADRIKKLEDGLRDVFSLGEWGTSALARTIILEALDEKD
jgi:hypothetical protein